MLEILTPQFITEAMDEIVHILQEMAQFTDRQELIVRSQNENKSITQCGDYGRFILSLQGLETEALDAATLLRDYLYKIKENEQTNI